MKKDVLSSADVFEKIFSSCFKYSGLYQCHYFGVRGLSWDAIIKMTKIELEKISDPDKYMFFEQGMNEVELVTLVKDIVKQIMNIVKIIIKKTLKNIFYILK